MKQKICEMIVGWKVDEHGDPGDEIYCTNEASFVYERTVAICTDCADKLLFEEPEFDVKPDVVDREPKTTDYCARCGHSPTAGCHALGLCAYYDPMNYDKLRNPIDCQEES